jgi:hydroxymethylpyrimidine kinase/phosphomethylpyrimidine kinase
MPMKTILTIAGFDPSSGAGITKDLDIFFSLGIHGVAVPTCSVLQGPQGVTDIHPTLPESFAEMFGVVRKQVPLDGIKTGVLWDGFYVEMVATFLNNLKGRLPLVVDPVMASKNGRRLITDKGLHDLITLILPLP